MSVHTKNLDFDIIIVHYHAAPLVRRAVMALTRDAAASGLSIQILVADNGSTTDERALLQSLDVMYLDTGRDAGYAGGINYAFPHTRAQSVVVMNEDVLVLPGCLATLRRALMDGSAVVGPEFYWDCDRTFILPVTEQRSRKNELLKAAGRRSLTALRRARDAWRDHARGHWRSTRPMVTTALSGSLLAFRRETWNTVGPFDEGYQMYFDENDWLLRVERASLRSVYVAEAKAVHLHNPKLASDADRALWSSESFVRFGNHYYGETFMRRLYALGRRQALLPSWEPLSTAADGSVEVEIPSTSARPVWIELTPSPLGYPAAAARLNDSSIRRWRLPAMRGLPFLMGTLYLEIVDDVGQELGRYCFERRSNQGAQGCSELEGGAA